MQHKEKQEHTFTYNDINTIAEYMFDNTDITIGYNTSNLNECFVVKTVYMKQTTEPFYKTVKINELPNIDFIMKEKKNIPLEWLCRIYLDKQPVREYIGETNEQ